MKIVEYNRRLGFKIIEKNTTYQSVRFLKCIRVKQVHVSSLYLKYALQNKFPNIFPMFLRPYIPNLKT